jgi:hypothetical protein
MVIAITKQQIYKNTPKTNGFVSLDEWLCKMVDQMAVYA